MGIMPPYTYYGINFFITTALTSDHVCIPYTDFIDFAKDCVCVRAIIHGFLSLRTYLKLPSWDLLEKLD